MFVKRKSFGSRRKMESLSLYLISMITFNAFYLRFIECCVANIDIVFTQFFLYIKPATFCVSQCYFSCFLLFFHSSGRWKLNAKRAKIDDFFASSQNHLCASRLSRKIFYYYSWLRYFYNYYQHGNEVEKKMIKMVRRRGNRRKKKMKK